MQHQKVQIMIEIALITALSFVLSQLRLFRMPQGGSITLAMVPLIVLALRRGVKPAMVAGVLLGFARLLYDPFIVHYAQVLLDYPLPYALLGTAGFFRRSPLVAVPTAAAIRFVPHVLSGVIFFGAYAPEGISPWWYAITYNASFLIPETLLTLAVIRILWTRQELFRVED